MSSNSRAIAVLKLNVCMSARTAAIVRCKRRRVSSSVFHGRMPVILGREDFGRWLDPGATSENLLGLLRPFPAGLMEGFPVGRWVNENYRRRPMIIPVVVEV